MVGWQHLANGVVCHGGSGAEHLGHIAGFEHALAEPAAHLALQRRYQIITPAFKFIRHFKHVMGAFVIMQPGPVPNASCAD